MSSDRPTPAKEAKVPATLIAVCAVIAVSALWLLNWFLLQGQPDTTRGTWGDMFGGINALFSGLAFVGVIYAILLQREGLILQGRELEDTREELAGQRRANEEQNRSIATQTFESTLFQMVGVLEQVIDAIDLRASDNSALMSKGRDTIRTLYRFLQDHYANAQSDAAKLATDYSATSAPVASLMSLPEGAYELFYEEHGHEVGHYFRVLYNIFKFIDGSGQGNKQRYAKIVRAQMSDYEVLFLFYNALSPRGRPFLKYINEYGLLKFTRLDLLLVPDHFWLHAREAFGTRYQELVAEAPARESVVSENA